MDLGVCGRGPSDPDDPRGRGDAVRVWLLGFESLSIFAVWPGGAAPLSGADFREMNLPMKLRMGSNRDGERSRACMSLPCCVVEVVSFWCAYWGACACSSDCRAPMVGVWWAHMLSGVW